MLIIDTTHHSIGGKEYYEYIAFDTWFGLLHRHLRKGRECTWGYRILLAELEKIGYKPYVVVSDGGTGIFSMLRLFSLENRHQRCHVHILRDMRVGFRMNLKRMKSALRKYYIYKYAKLLLDSRTDEQYSLRWKHFQRVVLKMWNPQGDGEKNVVKAFVKVLDKAFTFTKFSDVPTTTNQVEGYISNINTRLKTMRGLKSPANAELLLNAIHHYLKQK